MPSLLTILVILMIALLALGGGYGFYAGNRVWGGGNLGLLILFLVIMVLADVIPT